MKIIIIILISILTTQPGHSQINFHKKFGDQNNNEVGESIKQTSDGGYIITGTTGYPQGLMILTKVNQNCDSIEWTKTCNLDGKCVEQTNDGGYVIVGGVNYPSLLRTDSSGDTLWAKTYTTSLYDVASYVQQTSDDGFIITGCTSNLAGDRDVQLIKTDSIGNLLWSKTYGGTLWINESGIIVKQTTDGGYIIIGNAVDYSGNGNYHALLIKTDSFGNTLWTKTFIIRGNEYGNWVQQTNDGGYIIIGNTADTLTGIGGVVFLIKTDTAGNPTWTKTYSIDGYGAAVMQTIDGGYSIFGGFFGTPGGVYLIKCNTNGDTLWTKQYNGGASAFDQTNDGGYVMVGGYYIVNYASDINIIKTDSLGNSGCIEGYVVLSIDTPITQVMNNVFTFPSLPTTVTNQMVIYGVETPTITDCVSLGINEISNANPFNIFPNPATEYFVVSTDISIKSGDLKMFNILGEIVFEENISNKTRIEINVKNIPQGIYFIRLYDGKKNFSKKIIVEHN